MTAGAGWWKRRTRSQRAGLLVAAAAVLIAASAAASSDWAVEAPVPTSTDTSAVAGLLSPLTTVTTLAATIPSPFTTATSAPPLTATTTSPVTTTVSSSVLPHDVGQVVRVVDGDTIVVALSDGSKEEVRLIGIDTPETGEDFAQEATEALERLVGGANVRLETDAETRDQYNRLLAYVWVGGIMANEELLRQGLATMYTVPPDVKYVERFQAAQHEAETAEIGVWGNPTESPLRIVSVRYDPPGDDSLNLNEEYVTFKVLVSGTLVGYSIEDETGHRYRFPDRVFKKGDLLKLHSGAGTDSQTDLYWGASGAAIWNNDGDTVKVLDPQDQVVESYHY